MKFAEVGNWWLTRKGGDVLSRSWQSSECNTVRGWESRELRYGNLDMDSMGAWPAALFAKQGPLRKGRVSCMPHGGCL